MNSLDLIQCINKLREFKNVNRKIDFLGCSNEIDNSIIEEFLKDFLHQFYNFNWLIFNFDIDF